MKKLLYILISASVLLSGATPLVVLAQATVTPCAHATGAAGCDLGYTPLEPIPGLTTSSDPNYLTKAGSLPAIINAIFKILLTVGALLAVLMLTVGGIQYMVSSSAEVKTTGINKAQAALWGIVLLAAAYLILHTINPKLLDFNLTPCPGGSAGCTVTGTATNAPATGNVYTNTNFQQALLNQQATENAITSMTDAERKQKFDAATCASAAQQQTAVAQTAGSQGCIVTTSGVYGSAGPTQCNSYKAQYRTFGDQVAVCQSVGN